MKVPVRVVQKPWGHEIIYAHNDRYIGKIIVINKGHRLSLQFHRRKHETIYVLRGRCRVRLEKSSVMLRQGSAFAVAPRLIHRFEAPFGRVTLLEASTAQADDLVRLADDYGR